MSYNFISLENNIIENSHILDGERVLVIDDNTQIFDNITSFHNKDLVSYCYSGDAFFSHGILTVFI